ncbi:hypothetical protein O3P69_010821 [Scylla paramamosain]|uniref:Secreted protein n=1 Tax=Scylla paramamosain TaxID=85552 RepID=A0AAW0TGK1_SCYPA
MLHIVTVTCMPEGFLQLPVVSCVLVQNILTTEIPVFLKYHAPPTDQALRGDYTRRAASTKDGIQKLWMTLRLYKHPCSRDDGCCHY